jgi:4-hydroxy-tetrahydrodipicolinate reductase
MGQIGFVYGSNFSIGVNLMFKIARYSARLFSRFNVARAVHHRSASPVQERRAVGHGDLSEARSRSRNTKRDVPIASLRAGFIPGTHTVGFDSEADTLAITHTARSRAGFADGAIVAAEWIAGRRGFYEFSEIIDEQLKEVTGDQ